MHEKYVQSEFSHFSHYSRKLYSMYSGAFFIWIRYLLIAVAGPNIINNNYKYWPFVLVFFFGVLTKYYNDILATACVYAAKDIGNITANKQIN